MRYEAYSYEHTERQRQRQRQQRHQERQIGPIGMHLPLQIDPRPIPKFCRSPCRCRLTLGLFTPYNSYKWYKSTKSNCLDSTDGDIIHATDMRL